MEMMRMRERLSMKFGRMRALNLLLLLVFCGMQMGCFSTVRPTLREGDSPSLSGNVANSGIIATVKGKGIILNQDGLDHYNALVATYGAGVGKVPFSPAIKLGEGVTSYTWNSTDHYVYGSTGPPDWANDATRWPFITLYLLDGRHASALLVMNRGRLNAIAPYKP